MCRYKAVKENVIVLGINHRLTLAGSSHYMDLFILVNIGIYT